MKKWLLIFFPLLVVAFVANAFGGNSKYPNEFSIQRAQVFTNAATDFRLSMRQLWDDYQNYTRNFIISYVAGIDDVSKVSAMAAKTQKNIGNVIVSVYGYSIGIKLSNLLRDHFALGEDMVEAAKARNDLELNRSIKKWYANVYETAYFLSSINPNWEERKLAFLLHKHLELTIAEVTARLKKDWQSDIYSYDKDQVYMRKFADMLSEGIIKQFPSKFND